MAQGKKIAIYPGTFDPVTNGHLDVLKRAAPMFDEVVVAVAPNAGKGPLFDFQTRVRLFKENVADMPNVDVCAFDGLTVDFAAEHDISVIIRGVRAMAVFAYEFELAMTNKMLNPRVDVLFIPTDPKYFIIRSSQIKEMARFGADFSPMVPEPVQRRMKEKMKDISLQ